MKIFNSTAIRQIDAYTIEKNHIKSIELMEVAARSVFEYIIQHYDIEKKIIIFAGQGNNGGDALALARLLHIAGFSIKVITVFLSDNLSDDCETNYKALLNKNIPIYHYSRYLELNIKEDYLIIDGIFGTGLNKPITGKLADMIVYINSRNCEIIAIDIPSGLPSDGVTETNPIAIKATITISFQFPKISFFFAEYESFIGKWILTNIGLDKEYIANKETNFYTITKERIQKILRKRSVFSHKGTFGHCLLMNGSYGKMGAGILSAKACLRSGVGLLTTHIPVCGNTVMQIAVPEAMTYTDMQELTLTSVHDNINDFDAVGCGCGIGTAIHTQKMIHNLLLSTNTPCVLDADALNCIALNNWKHLLPKNTIITPHPKEFDRLVGESKHNGERLQKAILLSKQLTIVIILKGAYTRVVLPNGKVYFNTTGNPGMATAGSGDVLTGIIAGLRAQKYDAIEASLLGVYLHGLAGDYAKEKYSEKSLVATDIIENISEAYKYIL